MNSSAPTLDTPASSMKQSVPSHSGLSFEPKFATPGVSPFDEIEWDLRTAEITDDSGKALFRQENVEVPKTWSELATKIAVSKYFYGDATLGNDPRHGGREHSVRQLINRVTRTIADWGFEDGYFADEASAGKFPRGSHLALPPSARRVQLAGLVQRRPLSPVPHRRKSRGEGGWHWDETSGKARRATSQYHYPQASACFIQGVRTTWRTSCASRPPRPCSSNTAPAPARTSPRCAHRARNSPAAAARPDPLSFLRIYDQVAGAIKSGGKTRRAAKMNTLKDWHPDIEDFIEAKTIEEKKAWALIEQGYDGSPTTATPMAP
jgi:ribonucleoside-diphosphate reductase alpha chain